MTGGAPYSRRCSGQHGGRAVVKETAGAVRLGVSHVTALTGLSWWQRFLVACLKVVAILGYHWGKWCASEPNGRNSQPPSRRGLGALVDTAIMRWDSLLQSVEGRFVRGAQCLQCNFCVSSRLLRLHS